MLSLLDTKVNMSSNHSDFAIFLRENEHQTCLAPKACGKRAVMDSLDWT